MRRPVPGMSKDSWVQETIITTEKRIGSQQEDMNMDHDILSRTVSEFFSERGMVDHNSSDGGNFVNFDSFEYVALLVHVENALAIRIDDAIFFDNGIPERETIESLCERLVSARVAD
jgi:acyl carrier protein